MEAGKTVKQIVSEGVQEIVDMLAEFEAIGEAYGDPDADFDELAAKQARLQEKLDSCDGWNLDARLELAMDALRCPPADKMVRRAVGRREAPRGAVPAPAEEAGHPAAGRADEPPRRRDGGLARAAPARVRGHGHRGDPRPLLPRQRGRLDPRARPGRGHSLEGQLLVVARAEAEAARARGEGRVGPRQKTLERELEWIAHGAKGRHAEVKARIDALREAARRGRHREARRDQRSSSRPARAWATWWSRRRACAKGYGDKLLFEDLSSRAAGRGSWGSSAPTAPARPRCFRMITGQEKPDAGDARASATRSSSPTSDQMRERLDPEKTVWEAISRRPGHHQAGRSGRSTPGPTAPGSTSRARTSRRRWASSPAGSGTGCTWPSMLQDGANVLLLDEPTNDLDVDTHARPRGGARRFRRLRVVVSHDRWFLDRVVHAHPRLRGRLRGDLVRRQLHRVHGMAPLPARRRGGQTP